MAKVTINGVAPKLFTYEDAKSHVGKYIVNSDGAVFAIVYNHTKWHSPIIASVANPSNTWSDSLPGSGTGYRLLTNGETFTVKI